jgi:hypothetical protein
MALSAGLLFVIAPFSTLEPLGYLADSGGYSLRVNWLYWRRRDDGRAEPPSAAKELLLPASSTGLALYLLPMATTGRTNPGGPSCSSGPVWSLVAGFVLDARERRRHRAPPALSAPHASYIVRCPRRPGCRRPAGFIREIVADDLAAGKHGGRVTTISA